MNYEKSDHSFIQTYPEAISGPKKKISASNKIFLKDIIISL